ncbi:MAG: hypothetical protein WKF33_10885 [Thermoleophilaceae bacterium]
MKSVSENRYSVRCDVRGLPPLRTQDLNEEERERLANLGTNGPRDVARQVMTHCVPDERDVRAEDREPVAAG